jgi:hypothetical protein
MSSDYLASLSYTLDVLDIIGIGLLKMSLYLSSFLKVADYLGLLLDSSILFLKLGCSVIYYFVRDSKFYKNGILTTEPV